MTKVKGFLAKLNLEAKKDKYPEADYADFPRLGDSKQKEEGYQLVSDEEQLYLENAALERIVIPIEKEWLADQGDPLTGAANGVDRVIPFFVVLSVNPLFVRPHHPIVTFSA